MNLTSYIRKLKKKYKKNSFGAVVVPSQTISEVDKDRGVITLESSTSFVFSEEIEHIHALIKIVEELEEKASKYDDLCK